MVAVDDDKATLEGRDMGDGDKNEVISCPTLIAQYNFE